MKDITLEIEIKQKPVLFATFGTFDKKIREYTQKFEMEVTSENLKEAKESGAEINKIRKNIKELSKKYLDEIIEPIVQFEDELKKIDKFLEAKRDSIIGVVNSFEDAKRLEHTEAMREYMSAKLSEVSLRDEFANRLMLPSASISGFTQSGKLTKKYIDEIDAEIAKAIESQRLKDVEIENQRLKDEARAREIVEEMRQKEQEKAKEHLAYKEPEPTREQEKETNLFEHTKMQEEVRPLSEKSIYKITLEFEVQSKSGVDCDAMMQKVLPMIFDKKIQISKQKCEEM
jgi:hypothetical protein